jgi:hypothetical protein
MCALLLQTNGVQCSEANRYSALDMLSTAAAQLDVMLNGATTGTASLDETMQPRTTVESPAQVICNTTAKRKRNMMLAAPAAVAVQNPIHRSTICAKRCLQPATADTVNKHGVSYIPAIKAFKVRLCSMHATDALCK